MRAPDGRKVAVPPGKWHNGAPRPRQYTDDHDGGPESTTTTRRPDRRAKLTEGDVREARTMHAAGRFGVGDLALHLRRKPVEHERRDQRQDLEARKHRTPTDRTGIMMAGIQKRVRASGTTTYVVRWNAPDGTERTKGGFLSFANRLSVTALRSPLRSRD